MSETATWRLDIGTGRILDETGAEVCTMRATCVTWDWEQDAHLIATAPELLAAATGLCMWIRHILPAWDSEVQKYLDLTQAAIAKAGR